MTSISSFFPWLALRTGEGRFGNAPGFGPEPMATWRSAQLGVRLFPLLRGELVVDRVESRRRRRAADAARPMARANWEGIGGDEPADPRRERTHAS